MNFRDVGNFLKGNHRGVINTIQPNGAVQSSIVVCGVYENDVVFVAVRGRSAKIRNLRRNPACTVLGVSADWRNYVVVEGTARLKDSGNTDGEELRVLLRDLYRACGDKEHPDWEEYDQAMRQQRAVAVLVSPDRIYGLLR